MSNKIDYDYAKFESSMEKKISNRKMLGNISSSQSVSELGLMDQFFLFGISPNKEKNPVPTIMAAFPPFRQSAIPVENVLSLSMPHWDFSNQNSKSKSTSIFSSSCDNGIVDEFVFQFNAGETKMYGVCSHIQPSKAIRNSTLPFFATESTKKNIFCMCLITKLPIFNAHFTFLNYLASLSAGTILKQINSPENTFESKYETDYRVEHVIQNDTLIEGLEMTGTFGQILGITIPDEFQSKVFDYYSKTMYSSPFKLAPTYNIRFPPPTTAEQRLISWASLDTLFSVLSVRDIVELLAALILDAQVLIVGSSMQEVSMTVYGLYALLTPFKYCGIVMPIIPNNDHYLDLLSSPTPFIFGMPNIPKLKKMSFLESTYIVNVDKHKMPPVNYFPKYPSYASVVRKVAEIVASKDNTAFKPEDELFEINKGIKERSRSAIIAVNTIPGTRQIRIKPNFSPSGRKNYNTMSRVSINVNQNEKPANSMPSEKVESTNQSESLQKAETSGKADPFENLPKARPLQRAGNACPFKEVVDTGPLEKVENTNPSESFPKIRPLQRVGNTCPFKGIVETGPSEKVENTNPSESFPKASTSEKADPFENLPKVKPLQRAGDACPFKEAMKTGTSEKVVNSEPSENLTKSDTSEKVDDKKEEDKKGETMVQFPNFNTISAGPIRRRNTCMHIKFASTVQEPTPDPDASSNQPLSDFPTFKKPAVASDQASDVNPYKFPPDLTKKLGHKITLSKDSIDKIYDALHEPLESIFTDMLNCYFVTNSLENITIFNQSLFLASTKQEDLKFYEFLLESQTFQDYVETKLNEFTEDKSKITGQRRKSTFGPKTKRRVSTVKKPFDSEL